MRVQATINKLAYFITAIEKPASKRSITNPREFLSVRMASPGYLCDRTTDFPPFALFFSSLPNDRFHTEKGTMYPQTLSL